ncbi:hypothetical protein NPIL_658641 [Nephila pilipes]|uniref:Uncharacterized protein n=1 Tax=Nephila pilipes TaxID=299642 RepID=A0A8X6P6E3_NEPPI|nr:hypothetical protein NPIL_658641 [Nephila pilipes]
MTATHHFFQITLGTISKLTTPVSFFKWAFNDGRKRGDKKKRSIFRVTSILFEGRTIVRKTGQMEPLRKRSQSGCRFCSGTPHLALNERWMTSV